MESPLMNLSSNLLFFTEVSLSTVLFILNGFVLFADICLHYWPGSSVFALHILRDNTVTTIKFEQQAIENIYEKLMIIDMENTLRNYGDYFSGNKSGEDINVYKKHWE